MCLLFCFKSYLMIRSSSASLSTGHSLIYTPLPPPSHGLLHVMSVTHVGHDNVSPSVPPAMFVHLSGRRSVFINAHRARRCGGIAPRFQCGVINFPSVLLRWRAVRSWSWRGWGGCETSEEVLDRLRDSSQ